MESSQAVAPARFKMHRVPSDVLKLITQLLDVKELGRCARTSSVLAAAAVSGFEARARQQAPGLVRHAKRARGEPDWRKLCRKAMSFDRRPSATAGNEDGARSRGSSPRRRCSRCTPTTRSGGPSSRTSGSTACRCRKFSGWTARASSTRSGGRVLRGRSTAWSATRRTACARARGARARTGPSSRCRTNCGGSTCQRRNPTRRPTCSATCSRSRRGV